MRRRGVGLPEPEAHFMFGGPENEQAHTSPEGEVVPYTRADAAIDSMTQDGTLGSIEAKRIIPERDRRIAQIGKNVHGAAKIEKQRKDLAQALEEDAA